MRSVQRDSAARHDHVHVRVMVSEMPHVCRRSKPTERRGAWVGRDRDQCLADALNSNRRSRPCLIGDVADRRLACEPRQLN